MDKAFLKRVIIVVMGLCAVILLFSFVALIVDAVGYTDISDHQNNITFSVMTFAKWTSVATVCLMVPLFASYVFSCLSKQVAFCITSAALSLITAICAVSFICVLRQNIMDAANFDAEDYVAFTAYMQEMITVIVPCIVATVYYTVRSAQAFVGGSKTKKTEADEK